MIATHRISDRPRRGRRPNLVSDDAQFGALAASRIWCAGNSLPVAANTQDVRTIRCEPPASRMPVHLRACLPIGGRAGPWSSSRHGRSPEPSNT